jgi:hypothetical protein
VLTYQIPQRQVNAAHRIDVVTDEIDGAHHERFEVERVGAGQRNCDRPVDQARLHCGVCQGRSRIIGAEVERYAFANTHQAVVGIDSHHHAIEGAHCASGIHVGYLEWHAHMRRSDACDLHHATPWIEVMTKLRCGLIASWRITRC